MIEKLQEAFKDLRYTDKQHKYFTLQGKELQSVTKFLSSLKPEFDSDYWTTLKAYEFSGYKVKSIWNSKFVFRLQDDEGNDIRTVNIVDDHSHLSVSPEDVKAQWKLDALIGNTRGTYIHKYLEDLENRRVDVPLTELIPGMSTAEAVNYVNSLNVARQLCLEYLEFAQKNLIMVAAEYPVYDEKIGLAGTFDRLYFNKNTNQYEIWDFKTDKKMRKKSTFGKLKLFDLPDCEFEKYSLQTSLYKKMVQDATGVVLGTSRVVWFNLKEKKYEIIDCADYVNLINTTISENRWTTYQQY